jgi:dihydroxyacetone kinase-like protein
MESFLNNDGLVIVFNMIKSIHENKQYLSDIDGAIGDGDHGINMNKGFTISQEQLQENPGDLSYGLKTLGQVLISQIGGAMGPLYGMFFRSMARKCKGVDSIDAQVFGQMIAGAKEGIMGISEAKPGDKTLMDVLVPADEAYQAVLKDGGSFQECLDKMTEAARNGRDSTIDMVAKIGRSSRLGERSRGVVDAGAASCCLILETMASSIKGMLGG